MLSSTDVTFGLSHQGRFDLLLTSAEWAGAKLSLRFPTCEQVSWAGRTDLEIAAETHIESHDS